MLQEEEGVSDIAEVRVTKSTNEVCLRKEVMFSEIKGNNY